MFQFGHDCLCRKEAPQLGGFTSPLCWRCSAMLTGLLAGCLILCGLQRLESSPLLLGLLGGACVAPAGADVAWQIIGPYRSNRGRRLATGLPLGVGLVFLTHVLVRWFS